jgi:methionine-rich copper-binding protein CopC
MTAPSASRSLLVLAVLLFGTVHAHAYLLEADPAPFAVVSAPSEVTLQFTEPVEIRFSLFKVYPLEADLPEDLATLSEREQRRLNGLAGALVNEVLMLRDDAEARSDAGLLTDARIADSVTLALKDLTPGAYVVMWRVLSIDTHITQDFFVFFVGEG